MAKLWRSVCTVTGFVAPLKFTQFAAEDLAIEKPHRSERLLLGAGRDLSCGGEVTKKRRDLGCAQFHGRAAAVEGDELPAPHQVRFFGAERVVETTQRLAHTLGEGFDCGGARG